MKQLTASQRKSEMADSRRFRNAFRTVRSLPEGRSRWQQSCRKVLQNWSVRKHPCASPNEATRGPLGDREGCLWTEEVSVQVGGVCSSHWIVKGCLKRQRCLLKQSRRLPHEKLWAVSSRAWADELMVQSYSAENSLFIYLYVDEKTASDERLVGIHGEWQRQ